MSEHSPIEFIRSPLTWITVFVVVCVSGAFYWQNEREKTRERFERERIASEQAEVARVKNAEERRERERLRLGEEIRAQKDAEEEQRQQAIAIRQSDVQTKQFVADDRYVSPQQAAYQTFQMQQDQRERNSEDRTQRYEEENNLRRARQEVERQKRFLQQREYEDQSARYRREANSQSGR